MTAGGPGPGQDAADLPDAEIRRILRQRAAALARQPGQGGLVREVDLIAFRLGDQRFAIAADTVLQAARLGTVTWLPGLPAFYRGVVYQGGEVFPVLDVRPLLGMAVAGPAEATTIALLVEAEGRALALAADRLDGLVRLAAADIAPPAGSDDGPTLIDGLTEQGLVVLDIRHLIQDARLVVNGQPTPRTRTSGGSSG